MTDRRITAVENAESVAHGHAVRLEFTFSDGSREWLELGAETLAQFIIRLRTVAETAERARRAQPGQTTELVHTFTGTDVFAGTDISSGDVVLRFATTDQVPVMIAMSKELARATTARIAGELNRSRPKSQPDHH